MNRALLPLVPSFAFTLLFFGVPIAAMAATTFFSPAFSLDVYRKIFAEPVYLLVIWNTFRIAFFVTAICLAVGYPVAYWLSSLPARRANLLLAFVLLPYFTSVLVRTYAWLVLLAPNGIINSWLVGLHLVAHPIRLLYNEVGVLIGMVYVLLPYMILTLYATMRSVDRSLVRAAAAFGANPWNAFRRVFLPLSAPGVAAGSLLVFVIALGFFITPALMGGPRQTFIATLIEQQVSQSTDWALPSALAMLLLGITMFALVMYDRLVGLETIVGRR